MLLDILLNLHNGRERISVIHRVGQARPELGTAHPQEDTRRASIPGLWGRVEQPTRIEAPATIDEPLPTRTQTVLSYRVPENVRKAINGNVTDAMPASRRHGIVLDLKL
ncbi:MAG: hypothetical protein M3Q42_10270 [Pseudomonadota bacterium]|nr:hypothetical protein [Pseudomonadota bacterium]